MAGKQPVCFVDEYGHVEAEALDRARKVADLMRWMLPGMLRVGRKISDLHLDDL